MPHVDQQKLIKILSDSPATGMMCEMIPWQPNSWINLQGNAVPQYRFTEVSPTLYIDILVSETIDIVDFYIEQMIINAKDEWGGNV